MKGFVKLFSSLNQEVAKNLDTVGFPDNITHWRNNAQQSMVFYKYDLDLGGTAGVGFNVKAGDIIKIYVVDDLSNNTDSMPNIL